MTSTASWTREPESYTPKPTMHHVPPTHPDPEPRFLRKRDARHARAYKMLFGDAESFEEAQMILWHNWWAPPNGRPRFTMTVDWTLHKAYNLLFCSAGSFEDCSIILKNDWWTPPAHWEIPSAERPPCERQEGRNRRAERGQQRARRKAQRDRRDRKARRRA